MGSVKFVVFPDVEETPFREVMVVTCQRECDPTTKNWWVRKPLKKCQMCL